MGHWVRSIVNWLHKRHSLRELRNSSLRESLRRHHHGSGVLVVLESNVNVLLFSLRSSGLRKNTGTSVAASSASSSTDAAADAEAKENNDNDQKSDKSKRNNNNSRAAGISPGRRIRGRVASAVSNELSNLAANGAVAGGHAVLVVLHASALVVGIDTRIVLSLARSFSIDASIIWRANSTSSSS